MKRNFNYTLATVNVAGLTLHPLVDILSATHLASEAQLEMAKYFGHLERPVITDANLVLTHWTDVDIAKRSGKKTIEVYVTDIGENDVPMFVALKHLFKEKNYNAMYKAILVYTEYFNNEGKHWNDRIAGDLDEKLGEVLGCSQSHIKKIRSIGNQAPEELSRLQDGTKTFQQVDDELKEKKKAEAKPKKPEPKREDNPYRYFTSTITFENGETLEFSATRTGGAVRFNGTQLKDTTYTLVSDDDKGRNTPADSHVYLRGSIDDASLQFIFENPIKFLTTKNKTK